MPESSQHYEFQKHCSSGTQHMRAFCPSNDPWPTPPATGNLAGWLARRDGLGRPGISMAPGTSGAWVWLWPQLALCSAYRADGLWGSAFRGTPDSQAAPTPPLPSLGLQVEREQVPPKRAGMIFTWAWGHFPASLDQDFRAAALMNTDFTQGSPEDLPATVFPLACHAGRGKTGRPERQRCRG